MLKNLGPFRGVNNRRRVDDLTVTEDRKKVDLLASADNVDIIDDGSVRTREGYSKVCEGEFHSLWGDGHEYGYAVRGQELVAIDRNRELRTIVSGMVPGLPIAYVRRLGTVLWSDGFRLGAIERLTPLSFPAAPMPLASAQPATDGSLEPGQYQLLCSFVGPLGEGPSSPPVSVEVGANGAISISDLPSLEDNELIVYMTGPNGTVFNRVDYVEFEGRARIATAADLGAPPQTVGLAAMPAGRVLCNHHSRLLVARENLLIYSEPFAPLLMNPVSNFIAFEAPISVIASCGGGVFVCADKTYWLEGELSLANRREVLPYGAIPGSVSADPRISEVVYWVSPRGLVRGIASGEAVNVQESHLSLSGGRRATTYVRERLGQSHVVAATQSPELTQGAITTSIDCEIVRRSP